MCHPPLIYDELHGAGTCKNTPKLKSVCVPLVVRELENAVHLHEDVILFLIYLESFV